MHDEDKMTDEDRSREYLRQHPAQELSLWMGWVQTVCRLKKIAPPTGSEWDALTATWCHGKTPAESAVELVAMRNRLSPRHETHTKEGRIMEEVLNADERELVLRHMRNAAGTFYRGAVLTGCHPFIEFTGLMNEYIQLCTRAHNQGIDFTNCSKHSGNNLPMKPFEADYINEKLDCIFTGRIALAAKKEQGS